MLAPGKGTQVKSLLSGTSRGSLLTCGHSLTNSHEKETAVQKVAAEIYGVVPGPARHSEPRQPICIMLVVQPSKALLLPTRLPTGTAGSG